MMSCMSDFDACIECVFDIGTQALNSRRTRVSKSYLSEGSKLTYFLS